MSARVVAAILLAVLVFLALGVGGVTILGDRPEQPRPLPGASAR